jgi:hypothetical protein
LCPSQVILQGLLYFQRHRGDTDDFPISLHLKANNPFFKGKESIIPAATDILPWVNSGSPLANKDISRKNELAILSFDAQSLSNRVTPIGATALSLFMREKLKIKDPHGDPPL